MSTQARRRSHTGTGGGHEGNQAGGVRGVFLHDSAEISPHSESNLLVVSLLLEDAQTLGKTWIRSCLAAVVGGRVHLHGEHVEDVWGGGR